MMMRRRRMMRRRMMRMMRRRMKMMMTLQYDCHNIHMKYLLIFDRNCSLVLR
jgi:hypothetical protein